MGGRRRRSAYSDFFRGNEGGQPSKLREHRQKHGFGDDRNRMSLLFECLDPLQFPALMTQSVGNIPSIADDENRGVLLDVLVANATSAFNGSFCIRPRH